MAVLRVGTGFENVSGRLANLVIAQTKNGAILKTRPTGRRDRSPAQAAQARRLALVNAAWRALTPEEAAAWARHADEGAAYDPAVGRIVAPAAYSIFVALGTKRLQAVPGSDVPLLPPAAPFLGDALPLVVEPAPAALRLRSSRANLPGTLTEILAQPLRVLHNATKARSYASLGFFALEAGAPVLVPLPRPGPWAYAARYVEAASGRATELMPLGRAVVE